jgi:hypothetical protein
VLTIVVAAAAGGCRTSPVGGGPGPDEGFTIEVPYTGLTLIQGEAKVIPVWLNRDAGFKRAVGLEFKAQSGITVEPTQAVIKAADEARTHVRVIVPVQAPLGTYSVDIRGTPESGNPTAITIQIKVAAP